MLSPIASLLDISPVLKLLRARNAALVLGFLYEVFKERNQTAVEEETLGLLLRDYLAQNDPDGEADFPGGDEVGIAPDGELLSENRARLYLNRWCQDDYRYLRRVHSEEQQGFLCQLTPFSEKALQWLRELDTGSRAGYTTTESRFSRIFEELQQLSQQTKTDPKARLKALSAQRDALDAEIQEIRATGKVRTLQPAQIRDRLLDLEQMVEAFLGDFRAIEEHFREQAHHISEIHLQRHLSKGDVVEHALDANEELRQSEQGRSYYGFRALLGSIEQREQLVQFIADAAQLAAAAEGTDTRVFRTLLARLLEQDGVVQETFQKIAANLRRVVEESSTQNTRRLLEIIGEIKQQALVRRELPQEDNFCEISGGVAWAALMEARFYEPREAQPFQPMEPDAGEDAAALKDALTRIGKPFDMARFRRNVAALLADREQASLRQVLEAFPAADGAVDLVGYLCIAAADARHAIDEAHREDFDLNRPAQPRYATLNPILFQRQ